MAKSIRIQLNKAGIISLLQSPEVQADLRARANRIADAAGGATENAGDDFEVDVTTNRDRAVAFVRTVTHEARLAEAEDRALTRAIDAGR